MSLEELKAQQTTLVLQRSQAKDMIEQTELMLGQVSFAINTIEAQAKEAADKAAKAKAAKAKAKDPKKPTIVKD